MLSLEKADSFKGKEANANATTYHYKVESISTSRDFFQYTATFFDGRVENFTQVYKCVQEYSFRIIFRFLVSTSFNCLCM